MSLMPAGSTAVLNGGCTRSCMPGGCGAHAAISQEPKAAKTVPAVPPSIKAAALRGRSRGHPPGIGSRAGEGIPARRPHLPPLVQHGNQPCLAKAARPIPQKMLHLAASPFQHAANMPLCGPVFGVILKHTGPDTQR
jgi:hypothetical protein